LAAASIASLHCRIQILEGATTAWLANVLGSMIGVAVGAFIALFILHRQLRQDRELFVLQNQIDRELFTQTLAAERDKEKRARRRAVAVQLAAELKPAADRLRSLEDLDVGEAVWPDYKSCFEAVQRLLVLLHVNDLLGLWDDTISVLGLCCDVWGTTYRAVQECVDENPAEYQPVDPRIELSWRMATMTTSKLELASLVNTLLAWEGEGPLRFPLRTTIDELNAISPKVREQMKKPLRQSQWRQLLKKQFNSGLITEDQFDVRMAQVHASREDE
jgi:hypothetical protein